jgi:hypothetical protein
MLLLPTHCPNHDHQSQHKIEYNSSAHLKTFHGGIDTRCVHGPIYRNMVLLYVAMFLPGSLAHGGRIYHLER